MAKQLEFMFTGDGAAYNYAQHQLYVIKCDWFARDTQFPFNRLESHKPFKEYMVDWIESGKAELFRKNWHTFYFGNIVERQTDTSKALFELNNLYAPNEFRPKDYSNFPIIWEYNSTTKLFK